MENTVAVRVWCYGLLPLGTGPAQLLPGGPFTSPEAPVGLEGACRASPVTQPLKPHACSEAVMLQGFSRDRCLALTDETSAAHGTGSHRARKGHLLSSPCVLDFLEHGL